MVYGIMLVYYPNYKDKALSEFSKILNAVDPNYSLIIVNNNLTEISDGEIIGDNTNWEFSGWRVGLNSIVNLKNDDIIVFSNDTFCHHNKWNYIVSWQFSSGFKKFKDNNEKKPEIAMSGTCDSFNNRFEILGCETEKWVSTYLFAMTGKFLNEIKDKFCIDEKTLNASVLDIKNKKIIWGEGLSNNLKSHLETWMFPTKDGSGWYNSHKVIDEKKIRKLKTILNEKYLTAICYYMCGEVYEVKQEKVIKFFIKRLVMYFLKKNKYLNKWSPNDQ